MSAPSTDLDAALDALAAYGLAGSRHALPERPLADADFARLLESVASERLVGLLGAAIADGAWPVTNDQRVAAAALQVDVATASVLLERLLLGVVDRFAADGIGARVLKGPAVAHLDYGDPAWRSFGDLDLLVRGDDVERAIAALMGLGGHRDVPELRRNFDRRFGKGATIEMPGDLEVDLHRTLVTGPLGVTVRPDDLFATASTFALGGRRLDALGTEERFVHACVHAALSPDAPRAAVRDVAQLATAPALDFDRTLELARGWHARAAVARAIEGSWRVLALPDHAVSQWARGYRPDASERRALDAYFGGDRSYTRRAVATLRVIPGARAKVAFARSLLFPGREYLAAQRVRRFDHVRRGAAHLRRGGAR
ncbi:MAG TPA: nucleotidyltransferase family protein [Acidimicrobiia bacterium]|jgi:hypothetical protein|nr:nucleotidyltransferase family protein [Acidimicrobiia bacterium]